MNANEANLINEIRDHDLTKRKLEQARERVAELERTLARLEDAASVWVATPISPALIGTSPEFYRAKQRELNEAIAEAQVALGDIE